MNEEIPSNPASPARSETIDRHRDDLRLVGTLELPALAAGERVPLVIVMHGLTGDQDEPIVRSTVDALRAARMASVRFDFNGHGSSGGSFTDMTVLNELDDAQVVFDYVRTLGFVSSIGLAGHSQGGVVAAMLAGRLRDEVSALVLFSPATNIRDDAREGRVLGSRFDPINPPASIDLYGLRLGRDYLLTSQTLPIRELPAQYRGPVSLIQGGADELIPTRQAEDYVSVFDRAELHVVPGGDHNFYRDSSTPAALAVSFFASHFA